jgi:hypothetical protein
LSLRFEFKPKNPNGAATAGFDYGEGGYDPNKTGKFQIEIKGLAEPKSKEAGRICQEDLNEVIAAFVQDKTAIERGLFDKELVPEELTQVRMGKIVKDKYPELDEADQEAVRQHAIAALPRLRAAARSVRKVSCNAAATCRLSRSRRRRNRSCQSASSSLAARPLRLNTKKTPRQSPLARG